jgi:serine/threonine-protein kinase HipA
MNLSPASTTAGEILALTLAAKAGVRVAEHRLMNTKGRSVSVITRFDRDGATRIPFLSANSLLGLAQDEPGAYTMLADGIRQFGDDVRGDLRELRRRLVFSLLASNYDDHLRNHGFLMRSPGHWSLSPAHDLNPVPEIDRARTPRTAVTEEQEAPSVAVALEAAPRFGLRAAEATAILREVLAAVVDWRQTARRLRLSAGSVAAYASAFEHSFLEEAKKLGG